MRSQRARVPRLAGLQQGFTLLEFLVTSMLALLLFASAAAAISSATGMGRSSERTADLQSAGDLALLMIRKEIIHAGFYGLTSVDPSPAASLGTIQGECAAGFVANFRQSIWASNDSNPYGGTCIPSASYAQGDVLVVRRASLSPVSSVAAGNIYFRSAYARGDLYTGSNSPTFSLSPLADYQVNVTVFYVSPFTNSADENPKVPALYKAVLGPGPAFTRELVASGIENFQIQLGRTQTDGSMNYSSPHQLDSSINASSAAPNAWDDVNSVRLWILVRAAQPEPGFTNLKSYSMADQTMTPADGYRRELFTTTVFIRNRS